MPIEADDVFSETFISSLFFSFGLVVGFPVSMGFLCPELVPVRSAMTLLTLLENRAPSVAAANSLEMLLTSDFLAATSVGSALSRASMMDAPFLTSDGIALDRIARSRSPSRPFS